MFVTFNLIKNIKGEFLIPQVFSISKLNTQVLYAHIYSPTNLLSAQNYDSNIQPLKSWRKPLLSVNGWLFCFEFPVVNY